MRKSRYSEEQIIGMLREHEAGVTTKELCRKYGISDATFYKYKAKFGGMTVSDAQRLRTLEAENAKLKKLLAEQMLDNAARDLDLHQTVLRRWIQQYRDQAEEAFPGQGKLTPADDEVRRLKREVARLKAERDILKKAAAYFARDPL